MTKLINLKHLDIAGTGIMEMPLELGRLKCLQTLTNFFISKKSPCIGELGKLTKLRGKLSILKLQNIVSPLDALDAKLKEKYIEELELEWNALDAKISENQETILECLWPHTSLKSLTINYYNGKNFPVWVGHPSFSNIAFLHLKNCRHCCNMPPLGQPPSLQDLSVVGFDGIVTVDVEIYGNGSSSIQPFEALKVLRFEHMLNWEEWVSFVSENEGGAFPNLQELYIKNCPKITGGLPIQLPSLAKLVICRCPQLVASLPWIPAIREMKLTHCNEALLKELPTGMQKLKVAGFDAIKSLPSTSKRLAIENCRNLELPMHPDISFPEMLWLEDCCDSLKSFPLDLFPKLYKIRIIRCSNLESLTISEQHQHDLVVLKIIIQNCPEFVSFPREGLHAPNLTSFSVLNCGKLVSLPDKMYLLLPSLKTLNIENCPEVESFPEGGLPSNLNEICIEGCDKLVARRKEWGLQNLPFVDYLFIGSKSEDVKSFPEEGLLPYSLTSLCICDFPKLKSLDKGLQHLTSLEKLSIYRCLKLKYMSEEELPASLSLLQIEGCPLLKKQWQKKKGKEWSKIAHVPSKWIDDEFDSNE
jgi:Leucine-rich repeat (LRR) protein